MRIFLDANILFSAAYTDGAIRALLLHLRENDHTCCVDLIAIEEARRNLTVHRVEALAEFDHVIALCEIAHTLPPHAPTTMQVDLPEGDLHILRASIALNCDVLVTGDKRHFSSLFETRIQGTLIVSPTQLYGLI